MMQDETLTGFLEQHGYAGVPLRRTHAGHLELDAVVNGNPARLLVDTGAGVTIIDQASAERWAIERTESSEVARGYGGGGGPAGVATVERLQLDGFEVTDLQVAVLDLSSVNSALKEKNVEPIDGILGADLMEGRGAVIEYTGKTLHLKKA